MIIVSDFNRTISLEDPDALAVLLGERHGEHSANKFDVSQAGHDFPYVSMLAHGKFAVLYFFEKEGGRFFISSAEEPPALVDEMEFWDSEHADGIPMSGDVVVDASLAVRAVEAFARSGQQPDCVRWMEL